MATDQRKRRLNSSSTNGAAPEQFRLKRRDFKSPSFDFNFNFNSHVSLKWDDNCKKVVAKEDQIGVPWRFLNSFSHHRRNTKLADVVTLPKEVFELDDLTSLLSYEVWQSCLSEKERNYLMQFLPGGFDCDQIVQDLFSGDNFQFGNPLLTWSASLRSGDLHPDAIVQHEKSIRENKKTYYSELQQYHGNMISNLQHLKERCVSSKDPEAEISKMMLSRSRRLGGKNYLPNANGSKSRKQKEHAGAVPESLLSIIDDKLFYSDDQKLSAFKNAEIRKRISSEDVIGRHEKLTTPTNSIRGPSSSKKAEKLQKANNNSNDGAKYMSYMKISKKQHEIVMSMKQSGSSIQSKTLNRVLGNIDSFNVKPYEMFIEEEHKRIHDYWSNLAKIDIPKALENRMNGQSQRQQVMNSLVHEMAEKLSLQKKDEEVVSYGLETPTQDEKLDYSGGRLQVEKDKSVSSGDDDETTDPQNMDGESSEGASEPQDGDDSASQGILSDDDKEECNTSSVPHESPVSNHFDVDKGSEPSSIENQTSLQNAPLNISKEFHLSSLDNQSTLHISSLNVNKEFNPMDLNVENDNVTPEASDTRLTILEHHLAPQIKEACLTVSQPEDHSTARTSNSEEISFSSVKNMWPSIGFPKSYYDTPPTQYASAGETSFRHPHVPDQPAPLIDLESDLLEEGSTKDLLKRHTNPMPFFNHSIDRSELLQSVIKRDDYHQDLKKTGLEFHPTSDILLESTQFPGHFREPSFALDSRQKTQPSDLFMNPNIQDNIYSETRYSIQGQGQFPAINARDWNNARVPAPIQPSQLSSGEVLNHNWFPSGNPIHGNWSGSDVSMLPNASLGNGSSEDQSLYSVLSQCNTLHSRPPYNHVGSSEQIMTPPNYGHDIARGIPMTSNVLPQTASPFDLLSGNNSTAAAAASTLKNSGWMSLGNQTPGLHDPSGKPFMKPWNQ